MARTWSWIPSLSLALVLTWQVSPGIESLRAQEEPPLLEETDEQPSDELQPIVEDEAAEADADDGEIMAEGEEEAMTEESESAEASHEHAGDHEHAHSHEHADEHEAESEPAEQPTDEPQIELIKERYPNGAIKIEREVTQDAQGNYVNHGLFKTYDERGALTAQGEYSAGKRKGPWIRWYRSVTEAKMLSAQPYQQFPGPFISQATFANDELDGTWTIYDGKKRKISEWHFKDGRRHGPSTWWLPNGRKIREMNFADGELEGTWSEWRPDGSLIGQEMYTGGRKQAMKVSHHKGGAKKSEGMYLFAKEIEQTPDDWWQCKPMTLMHTGKDERHGAWNAWYANGQRQQEGTYEHDMQVGAFSWWHSNGQKALQGNFEQGKQNGRWTWWYANGQKQIQGEYSLGNPTGRWTWWKEDGKVAQSADLSQSEGVAIEMPTVPDLKKSAPQAKKPQPQRMPIKR